MKRPICLSPLKFYDSEKKQNHRKTYAYGRVSPVITKLHVIPSFQFVIPNNLTILSVYIKDINSNNVTGNILQILVNNGLSIKTVDDISVIMFCSYEQVLNTIPEGFYYIVIKLSDSTEYYSEIFCFTANLEKYLEIEYWNASGDLYIHNGIITFSDNFRFKMYVNYEKETIFEFEEQANNRLGYRDIESQVSKKLYAFITIVPEFMCDAMRIIRLCDNKKIRIKNEEYDLIAFEMEADWLTQGDLAAVTCRFESDQVITSLTERNLAEYNSDFNSDFTV